VITNNTAGGNPSNLVLGNNAFITLGTGANVPTAGMNIGVTKTANNSIIMQSGALAAHAEFFTADAAGYDVVYDDGALRIAQASAAPCTHIWGNWVVTTPETCTAAGVERRECTLCGEYETRAIAMLEHNWSAWTVTTAPTYTTAGVESRTCSLCGDVETRNIPMLSPPQQAEPQPEPINAQRPNISTQPQDVTVTIPRPPIVGAGSTRPQDNTTNGDVANANASESGRAMPAPTLSVAASSPDGGVLTFQWYRATGASGGSFTRIAGATTAELVLDDLSIGINRYRVVITNTNNARNINGERTATITSRVATVAVSQPYVWITGAYDVELISYETVASCYGIAYETRNYDLENLFALITTAAHSPQSGEYNINLDLSGLDLQHLNPHRITARINGRNIGGTLDPETGYFSLTTNQTGTFEIVYVQDLTRLRLNLNSPTIIDLAGNAEAQTMDVLPMLQNGRTLIPVRFIA